ncbi:MAG: hypothetical protein GY711_17010 [bacterium]|nr:hypothetical protein [bacterium]
MNKPALLALSLLLALSGLTPLAPAQGDALPDLKEEVDVSIRWLRSVQDAKTGAYGDGVASTGWVLRALAASPRKYRRGDGPLVAKALDYLTGRQDGAGWIADDGATGKERLAATSVAAAALTVHLDETTRDALGAALKRLATEGVSDPDVGMPTFAKEETSARKRTVQLLASRKPEGYWDGAAGRVVTTAHAVLELSKYRKLLTKEKAIPIGSKPLPGFSDAKKEEVDRARTRGMNFLLKSQVEPGRWGAPGQADAGLTAMVLGALLSGPQPRPEALQSACDQGLVWLAGLQKKDGSIHQGRVPNYVTSAAILAFVRSGDARWREVIERAQAFLVNLQSDEGEGYSEGDAYYGGIGYGGDERPDLSNLQMALEALSASGLDEDHTAYKRAVKFLERCQNRSESNDTEVADGDVVIVSGEDGGAAYYPGNSKAGYVELEGGKKIPRSYGSMTYALLKSFVFAGLKKDDPRVEACWKWLQENYTLDINPGMEHSPDPTAAYQGLYYYFHSMARALNVFGADVITDGAGAQHAWRTQLAGRILSMQSKIDGSWVNVNAPRWWEGNPVLATSYALLTLAECRAQ